MSLVSVTDAPVARASSLADKLRFAEQLAQADMLPQNYRRKPGNVLLAVEYGEMLGMHPLTAIQQVHVIDGKLSMSAELMRALVRKAGHTFRQIESTNTRAEVEIVRYDDPTFPTRSDFTLDDAASAGLCKVKDGKASARSSTGKVLPWEAYTKAMLLARATSACVRSVCPEVLMGISYVPDELGAMVTEDGEVIDVEEIADRPDPLTWVGKFADDDAIEPGPAKSALLTACAGDRDLAAALWDKRSGPILAGDLRGLIEDADSRPSATDDGEDDIADAELIDPDALMGELAETVAAKRGSADVEPPPAAPSAEGAAADSVAAAAPPRETPDPVLDLPADPFANLEDTHEPVEPRPRVKRTPATVKPRSAT